jgi:hypothetical protein
MSSFFRIAAAAAALAASALPSTAAPLPPAAALIAPEAGSLTEPVQYWGGHHRPHHWGHGPGYGFRPYGPRCSFVPVRRFDPYWGGWRVITVRRCW